MSKITDCIDCSSRYSPRISFGASRMEEKRLVSWIEVVMVTPMMVARALIIVMGSGIVQDDYVGLSSVSAWSGVLVVCRKFSRMLQR